MTLQVPALSGPNVHSTVDLDGVPHLTGRPWTRLRKNKESATFEYDPDWLRHPARFALEPALTLGPGALARAIAAEVAAVVSTWRAVARRHGISRQEIDRMASAFEHRDLEMARVIILRS